MEYAGVRFAVDEIEAFRTALVETPASRILSDVIDGIRNAAKVKLQVSTMPLEEMRVQQGVILAMNSFKDVVKELLMLDVEEFLKDEVENNVEEVESEPADVRW
jgi:hypothetical protein